MTYSALERSRRFNNVSFNMHHIKFFVVHFPTLSVIGPYSTDGTDER